MANLSKEIYLFAALGDAQLERVASAARSVHLQAGQRLFGQGDPAEHFFVVERGSVKLYRVSPDGHEKVMGVASAGQTFAEGILFMPEPRYPVNAQALAPSTITSVRCRVFLEILEASFPACRELMARMVQRTQRHLDEIEALTLQNARFRLVNYLLRLVPPGHQGACAVTLPTRKEVIAAQLAVQPETLSRLLRDLERERVLTVAGGTVRIHDVAALQRAMG